MPQRIPTTLARSTDQIPTDSKPSEDSICSLYNPELPLRPTSSRIEIDETREREGRKKKKSGLSLERRSRILLVARSTRREQEIELTSKRLRAILRNATLKPSDSAPGCTLQQIVPGLEHALRSPLSSSPARSRRDLAGSPASLSGADAFRAGLVEVAPHSSLGSFQRARDAPAGRRFVRGASRPSLRACLREAPSQPRSRGAFHVGLVCCSSSRVHPRPTETGYSQSGPRLEPCRPLKHPDFFPHLQSPVCSFLPHRETGRIQSLCRRPTAKYLPDRIRQSAREKQPGLTAAPHRRSILTVDR